MSELLPERAWFGAGDEVRVEVRGVAGAGELTLWRLGEQLGAWATDGPGFVSLGTPAAGCYGVEWTDGTVLLRTAVQVAGAGTTRLRYGFTVDYTPGRDPRGLADTVRRLHLTDVQFYDWAYRHADLLGGGEDYDDALGQPVSLATVRRLADGVRAAGARALGYAAVYAVGPREWDGWKQWALLDAAGEPYALGDFLFIVDPAAVPWLSHFRDELAAAVEAVGFDGFHLDQYGYPKHARRADGRTVDVARSFDTMIGGVRDALPDAHLVFNNVNDFPTWTTAASPQDAVYIEVWDPHLTLGSLASVVTRARAAGGDKPVAIAAYQHVYDSAPAVAADRATAFTMATLFSHGATQLLAGRPTASWWTRTTCGTTWSRTPRPGCSGAGTTSWSSTTSCCSIPRSRTSPAPTPGGTTTTSTSRTRRRRSPASPWPARSGAAWCRPGAAWSSTSSTWPVSPTRSGTRPRRPSATSVRGRCACARSPARPRASA